MRAAVRAALLLSVLMPAFGCGRPATAPLDAAPFDAAPPDANTKLNELGAALLAQDQTMVASYTSQIEDSVTALYVALTTLELQADPDAAKTFIEESFVLQNLVAGMNYGCFTFTPTDTDPNATAFASMVLSVLWNRWSTVFDPVYQAELRMRMAAAGACLLNNAVSGGLAYTNIYVQSAVSLVLLGEAIGDSAMASAGYDRLDAWYAFTQLGGVAEYISPTYTAVDINALNMAYLFALDPGEHIKAKNALDFLWTDVKANVFPATGNLAGAHSRDYDWMQGVDDIAMNLQLWFEADLDSLSTLGGSLTGQMTNLQNILLYENAIAASSYHPSWDSLPVSSDVSRGRFISEAFPTSITSGGLPGTVGTRENYVTPDFALGYSNPATGAQNKNVNLSLNTTKQGFPNITVVPELYDDPYGEEDDNAFATPGGPTGVEVRNHISLHPACAQKGGALLTTFDLDANTGAAIGYLTTNILLPINADTILVNGLAVDPATLSGPSETSLALGGWVEIREQNTAVAIQMVVLDELAGLVPQSVLKVDTFNYYAFVQNQIPETQATLVPTTALRWTVYHYRGPAPQTFTQQHLRGAIVMIAQHVATDQDWAAFVAGVGSSAITTSTSTDGTTWTARVALDGSSSLEVSRSTSSAGVFQSFVDGVQVPTPTFTVDGRDLTTAMPFFQ